MRRVTIKHENDWLSTGNKMIKLLTKYFPGYSPTGPGTSLFVIASFKVAVTSCTHMRVWPVHVVSFKFATFCVSFLLPRSYSYCISSVFQFNEVVGRARECETFSNRPIAPRGSRRPERCLREVEKNATGENHNLQLESKVLRPWKGSITSSRWYFCYIGASRRGRN